MTRRELVRLIVLNSICEDYENVDQYILRDVAKEGASCGLTIERFEVVETLASLIEDGLAKAYLLSATEPIRKIQGMPQLEAVEEFFETYFYITPKGMILHLSDDLPWPPCDDMAGSST
jgi:hypothetical protein